MQRWGPQRRVSWKPAGFHRIKWEKSVSGPFPTFDHRNIMWFPCLGNKPTNCRFFYNYCNKEKSHWSGVEGPAGVLSRGTARGQLQTPQGNPPKERIVSYGSPQEEGQCVSHKKPTPQLLSPWETIITLNLLFFLNAFSLKVTLPTSSFFSTK